MMQPEAATRMRRNSPAQCLLMMTRCLLLTALLHHAVAVERIRKRGGLRQASSNQVTKKAHPIFNINALLSETQAEGPSSERSQHDDNSSSKWDELFDEDTSWMMMRMLVSSSMSMPDDVWKQVGSDILPSRPGSFGRSVALNYDGSVVAAGGENANLAQAYRDDGDDWVQIPPDLEFGGGTGFAVSLNNDGDRVAVSASRASSNGLTVNGAVHILQEQGGIWTPMGDPVVGGVDFEQIGEWEEGLSLSESGLEVAIGSFRLDNGTARVYKFIDDEWKQLGTDITGESEGGQYGFSVSLRRDGTRLAAGARSHPFNTIDRSPGPGQVRVHQFEEASGEWVQVGQSLDGEKDSDDFGVASSLTSDGNILAVGAERAGPAFRGAGKVYVYEYSESETVWKPLGAPIQGEDGEGFGQSVSISSDGMRLAVGSRTCQEHVSGGDTEGGAVRIFDYYDGAWKQVGQTICDDDTGIDNWGLKVSLSGDGHRVASGSTTNNYARVYMLEETR